MVAAFVSVPVRLKSVIQGSYRRGGWRNRDGNRHRATEPSLSMTWKPLKTMPVQ